MSELGERLRSRRMELGLSVSEVARRSGVNRTYLSRLERSDRNVRVSAKVIHGLADTLNTSPYDLVPELAGHGGEPRGSSPLADTLRDYLAAGNGEPDPRLVGRLATLPIRVSALTPDEFLVVSDAQAILMLPTSDAMLAELRARLPEIGSDLEEMIETRIREIGSNPKRTARLRLAQLFIERARTGSIEPPPQRDEADTSPTSDA